MVIVVLVRAGDRRVWGDQTPVGPTDQRSGIYHGQPDKWLDGGRGGDGGGGAVTVMDEVALSP